MLLAVSATFLVAGVVVYSRARDRVWNRIYAVHALSAGVWIFCNYLIESGHTPAESGMWLRIAHPLSALVVCTAVDLAWVFPEKMSPAPRLHRVILYSLAALFGSVGLSPDLYKSLTLSHGLVVIDYGWPFVAFGVFVTAVLGYSDYVFFGKVMHLKGLQRVQVIYILAGMLVGQVFAIAAIIVIPLVLHDTTASHWGAGAYAFMVLGMAYAIAKYQIVKPKAALLRAASYLVALSGAGVVLVFGVLVAEPFLTEQGVPVLISYLACGLATGVVTIPGFNAVRKRLERLGTRPNDPAPDEQYAPEAMLRTLDVQRVLEYVCDLGMARLRPTRMCVMLVNTQTPDLLTRAFRDAERPGADAPWLEALPADHVLVRTAAARRAVVNKDDVFRFFSLQQAQVMVEVMTELQLQLLSPLLWEGDLVGLICLGEKASGEMYEETDLDLLASMSPQVSLAVRNAQLYDEMARTREFSENILREMESGVIAVSAAGSILLYNAAAARILGLEPETVVGAHLSALPPGIGRCFLRALEGPVLGTSDQFDISRPDGSKVPVTCSASNWGAQTPDRGAGAVAVIHDLTLVQELEREREESERLATIRFLAAGMAHEIRNPLVAIRTFAELLPAHWEDEEFRNDFMVTAQGEIDRIVGLVSALLMLSKPANAVNKEIRVDEVCETAVRAMSAQAESRGVRLELEVAPLSLSPRGDAHRLHQALINLIGNAVDAEPAGGRVRLTASEAGNGRAPGVLLSVFNPGSYIPPEQAAEIFQPFYSQKANGTGLGLAICQTIIEEHDGTLEVRSGEGAGTEFIIHLPVSEFSEAKEG
jgi:PAS domain S-box-containing protein